MEITCKKEDFMKGIHTVQPVVGIKSTLPILANVLLEAKENKLELSGTDLEVGVKCSLAVNVVREGAITVPARTLSEVVRELPLNEVKLTAIKGDKIQVTSGTAFFLINGLPKEDYPVLPKLTDGTDFLLEAPVLSEMIKKTVFAVSQDETRYVLCGIYAELKKGKLKMVATDGRRLSYISREVNLEKRKESKAIIPTKAINELNRIISQIDQKAGEDNKVKISLGENQVGFVINETILVSRLIEGHYPNYEQVIPTKSDIKVKANTDQLLQATRRVALLTNERSTAVKYSLEKNRITLSATAEGLGEARDVVDVEYEGPGMEVAYNPQFIMDVLRNIGSEEIFWEFTDALNPCVIKPTTGEDYISIVMPMRL